VESGTPPVVPPPPPASRHVHPDLPSLQLNYLSSQPSWGRHAFQQNTSPAMPHCLPSHLPCPEGLLVPGAACCLRGRCLGAEEQRQCRRLPLPFPLRPGIFHLSVSRCASNERQEVLRCSPNMFYTVAMQRERACSSMVARRSKVRCAIVEGCCRRRLLPRHALYERMRYSEHRQPPAATRSRCQHRMLRQIARCEAHSGEARCRFAACSRCA